MFKPHPTSYSPFAPYGVTNSILDFPVFQAGESIIDSGGPIDFRNTIFSVGINGGIASGPPLEYDSSSLARQPQYKMDNNDMEAQEEAARNFKPVLEGPLVGPRQSSRVITEEYAKADPVYIAKTAALPQKYSHFRAVLGDGNCGWRAIGFSYFETLVHMQSEPQFRSEIARMTSLNNFLENVGEYQSWLFEDMVDETINLLKDLAANLHNPQLAAEILLQRFNDPEVSDPIVYHLRLLAASWLKSIPANYQGFIQSDLGLEGYSKECLEAPNQVIDHVGMQLLIDVLMKPVGITVEIVYLDRTEGPQVNSHYMPTPPDDVNGNPTEPIGPVVHLLYRPDHYDILYKDRNPSISLQQPMGEAIQNSNIQVNRATNFSQLHAVQNTPASMNLFPDMIDLLSIPGFSLTSHHGMPAQYSLIERPYTASPIPASPVSPGPSPMANSSTSVLSLSTAYSPQQSSTLESPALNATFPPATQLPIHTLSVLSSQPLQHSLSSHPSLSSLTSDIPSPMSANSSFRPSKYEWEAAADWQDGPVTFQTTTFKNSHYNTAHYNNPNFQPEEWTPDCEEAAGWMSGGRKRSH